MLSSSSFRRSCICIRNHSRSRSCSGNSSGSSSSSRRHSSSSSSPWRAWRWPLSACCRLRVAPRVTSCGSQVTGRGITYPRETSPVIAYNGSARHTPLITSHHFSVFYTLFIARSPTHVSILLVMQGSFAFGSRWPRLMPCRPATVLAKCCC